VTTVLSDGWIEFRFYRPRATHVCVAGNFNGWRVGADAMEPAGDGWWRIALPLSCGEYRFRYVADGHWYTDFAASGVELGRYGWNSMLLVPAARSRVAA